MHESMKESVAAKRRVQDKAARRHGDIRRDNDNTLAEIALKKSNVEFFDFDKEWERANAGF